MTWTIHLNFSILKDLKIRKNSLTVLPSDINFKRSIHTINKKAERLMFRSASGW